MQSLYVFARVKILLTGNDSVAILHKNLVLKLFVVGIRMCQK